MVQIRYSIHYPNFTHSGQKKDSTKKKPVSGEIHLRIFVELPQKAEKKKLKSSSSQNALSSSPEPLPKQEEESKLPLEYQLELDNAIAFYSEESDNSCLKGKENET